MFKGDVSLRIELAILKQIRREIAHIMACYGDEPEELIWKLECLVVEWFDKGLTNREIA